MKNALSIIVLAMLLMGCMRTYTFEHTKPDGEVIRFRASIPAGDSELSGLSIPTAAGAVTLEKYGQQDRSAEVVKAAIQAAMQAAKPLP